jgi:DHA3 family macrolide efflux protein-like MFS transporter
MNALPMQWVLSVDIITAIIAIGCLLPLAIPQPPSITLTIKFNAIGDMIQGFHYLVSWRGLLYLVVLCSMLNFFLGPVTALLPLFVKNYLGGDVLKLGWLETALGVGIIAGGLILSAWSGFKRRILTCFMGLLIWGIAIFTLGFTTESLFLMGLAMGLLAGLGNTMFNAPMWAIMQKGVARDIQGRVFTLTASLAGVLALPSLAITGPVANAIGVRVIFFISGAAILIMTIVGFFSSNLMNIENQKVGEKAAEEAPSIISQT